MKNVNLFRYQIMICKMIKTKTSTIYHYLNNHTNLILINKIIHSLITHSNQEMHNYLNNLPTNLKIGKIK